jgi:hypothetical protein
VSTDLERFLATDGRDEAVARVRSEIDARGITYIYYQFASVTGRIMGKGVPAAHWERMAEKGFQLVYGSTANLFTDRHGNYIGYGRRRGSWSGCPMWRPSARCRGTRRPRGCSARCSATGRRRLTPAAT